MDTPINANPPLLVDDGTATIDRENAFLLYASFCGDIARTAHALSISPTTVLRVADEEGWAIKLAPILELKKGTKPGDIERAMNRAVNFVQAHRMRLFINKIMNRMAALNSAEFDEMLFPTVMKKDGTFTKHFSSRPFADLAAAMEKAQALSYSALNDTAPERIRRKDNATGEASVNEMHAKLAQAMAEVGASRSPRAMLFDQQIQDAESLRLKSVLVASAPANPNDDDEH